MVRLRIERMLEAAQLLGLSREAALDAARKVELLRRGILKHVVFSPEERDVIIAAMYLENPLGYKVDLARLARNTPGNPWRGIGDILGIDTPDARKYAENVIERVNEALRRKHGLEEPGEAAARKTPPITEFTSRHTAVLHEAKALAEQAEAAASMLEEALENLTRKGLTRIDLHALAEGIRRAEELRRKYPRVLTRLRKASGMEAALSLAEHFKRLRRSLERAETAVHSIIHELAEDVSWRRRGATKEELEELEELFQELQRLRGMKPAEAAAALGELVGRKALHVLGRPKAEAPVKLAERLLGEAEQHREALRETVETYDTVAKLEKLLTIAARAASTATAAEAVERKLARSHPLGPGMEEQKKRIRRAIQAAHEAYSIARETLHEALVEAEATANRLAEIGLTPERITLFKRIAGIAKEARKTGPEEAAKLAAQALKLIKTSAPEKLAEEIARFIAETEPLIRDAEKALREFNEVVESRDTRRIGDYAAYLARLATRLEEARNQASLLYPAGMPPTFTVEVGGRRLYAKTELPYLEAKLFKLYTEIKDKLRDLAVSATNYTEIMAEKLEGMKLGEKMASLHEELAELLEKARTPEDYAQVVQKFTDTLLSWGLARIPPSQEVEQPKPQPPAKKKRGRKWPPEIIKIADYLWENMPPKTKRKWRYIQVLHLARLIHEKAREAGVDWRNIDWLHEIDWEQGYEAAKHRINTIIQSKSRMTELTPKEIEQYAAQTQLYTKPAEEKPEEWEEWAWYEAKILY